MIVLYDSNNSGGSWWLTSENWEALEQAGWTVHWAKPDARWGGATTHYNTNAPLEKVERTGLTWLGAEATSAAKDFPLYDEAIEEWERVTGFDSRDEGCNCCGPPHSFAVVREDGSYVGGEEMSGVIDGTGSEVGEVPPSRPALGAAIVRSDRAETR